MTLDDPLAVDWREISAKLKEPFPPDAVEFKPQAFTKDGTRALAVAYITARDVMDRLDDVVGAENWSFEPHPSPGNAVIGVLTIYGVSKADVGWVEGADEAGIKGSVSDALKRAGVLWGIGRYLYALPGTWWPWDATKRAWENPDGLRAKVVGK